jgi:DMSO/TMAO reductase YedYZ molybdopterin-dependent catalytic subunit
MAGIPLGAILQKAGVQNGAVEVVLEGADSGEPKDPPKRTGPIRFARSLPMAKATHPDVLVAHQMNGATLSPAHGFPVRAIVPDWYGVASVKWLFRIVVTKEPFHGHFQAVDYAVWQRRFDLPNRVPVTQMQVKAQIARPAAGETVKAGTTYPGRGWVWTGEAEIA